MRVIWCAQCGFFDPSARGSECRCPPRSAGRVASKSVGDDEIVLVTDDGSEIEIVDGDLDSEEEILLPEGIEAIDVAVAASVVALEALEEV